MSDSRRCPQCDAEIPANSPAGLCPACLLRAANDSHSAAASAEPGPTVLTPPNTGFVPPSVEELAPLFPQLEVLELLGKGGMGAVYKARQPGLDRLVALKILPTEISRDPAFAERFQREARALAKLSHPHIVAVYDFGQTLECGGSTPLSIAAEPLSLEARVEPKAAAPQSRSATIQSGVEPPHSKLCYIVMEFVDGANLRQMIKAGSLKPAEALAIVPQICEALQFAHDEGIVHRDIKPENILIDKRGRVKIADFGLAKLMANGGCESPGASLTATHQVMGTLRYMAPEQMQGSREVDHRADIYSLGVVFYELLTGELPMGKFAPPSKKVQVDVRLDEVVLRALEQDPEQRYQHASDVKSELDTIRTTPAPHKPVELKDPLEPFRDLARFATTPDPSYAKRVGIPLLILLLVWITATVTAHVLYGQKENYQEKPILLIQGGGLLLFVLIAFGLHLAFLARRKLAGTSGASFTGAPLTQMRFAVPITTDIARQAVFHFSSLGYQVIEQQSDSVVLQRGDQWAGLWETDIRKIATRLTVLTAPAADGQSWVSCDWSVRTLGAWITRRDIRQLEAEGDGFKTLLGVTEPLTATDSVADPSKRTAKVAQRVQAPADCLLLAAGIAFVTACGVALWLVAKADFLQQTNAGLLRGNLTGAAVTLAVYAGSIGVAGVMLRRLQTRLFVLLVAVVVGLFLPAVIALNVVMELPRMPEWPVVTPLWLGIPAVLWAVVTLFRDDVRRTFETTAERRRLIRLSRWQSQIPNIALEPRFSRFAIAGAVWAIFGLLTVFPVLYFIGLNRVWNGEALPSDVIHSEPPLVFSIFMGTLLVIGAGAPIGTTIFGSVALGHIKRSEGRIIGSPLAFADAIFFPLLAVVAGIAVPCALALRSVLPLQLIAAVGLAASIGFFIARAAWRTLGPQPRGDEPNRRPIGPEQISLWAAISGVILPALLLIGGIVLSSRVSIPDGFVVVCFMLGLGLELVAVGCGIATRSTTPGKAGLIVGSIALLLWLATLTTIPTRVSRHSSELDAISESELASLPPLGTITSGIGVEFTVPAGQVATFEIVTRRDGETVPVPPHCGYVMASPDKPETGIFRWTPIAKEEGAGSHQKYRIEMLTARSGGGHSEASLLPVELNAAVGARGLPLGRLEPNEEVTHWGTADANNLPANGLIGLRVTVVAHGLNHGGSGTAHIDWKKTQSATSTTRRKLPSADQ